MPFSEVTHFFPHCLFIVSTFLFSFRVTKNREEGNPQHFKLKAIKNEKQKKEAGKVGGGQGKRIEGIFSLAFKEGSFYFSTCF